MWAAARIAVEMNTCDLSVYARIRTAIHAWGKLPVVNIQTPRAIKLLQSDKKTEAGIVNFVLTNEIGKVEIVTNVPRQVVALALDEIRRASRE
jgi:3-dehydroquinate synthetase